MISRWWNVSSYAERYEEGGLVVSLFIIMQRWWNVSIWIDTMYVVDVNKKYFLEDTFEYN